MKYKKLVFSIFLSVVLLYFVLSQIKINDLTNVFSSVSIFVVLWAFFLYGASYIFRALRLKILTDTNLKLSEFFKVTCIHNFFSQTLPFRTGELSLIYLLNNRGMTKTNAAALLVLARVFDFLTIVFIFIISLLFVNKNYLNLNGSSLVLIYLSLGMLVIIILSLIKFELILKIFQKILTKLGLIKFKFFKNIFRVIESVGQYYKTSVNSKKRIYLSFMVSLIIWGVLYFMTYIIINSVGVELQPSSYVFAISLVLLFNSLPIHGFLNFGTQEVYWVFVFTSLGLENVTAILSGLVNHILAIIYFLTYGILALIFNRNKKIEQQKVI